MQNFIVSRVFYSMADLLEILGEESFKVRAYRRAAETIERLPLDISQYASEGRLIEIPGVGKNLAGKIEEILRTGTCHQYEDLQSKVPEGVIEMLRIPGLGPKSVSALFSQLGLKSMADLESAVSKHRVRELKGFGAKREEIIRKGLEEINTADTRVLLGFAWPLAEEVAHIIRKTKGVNRVEVAGSVRRRTETVGDIDIVASASDGEAAMDAFTSLPVVREVMACGPTKASVMTRFSIQMDLRVVSVEQFYAAWHHFTGSKAHHIRLRGIARAKGLKINEYGVWNENYSPIEALPVDDEESIYSMLDLRYIPPELREDTGEIEAGSTGCLPDLVEESQIKGDLHVHSSWSDGVSGIEEIAMKAADRGYEYVAISDHSRSLTVAGGLNEARLRQQIEAIEEINRRLSGIRILKGIEVDILKNGNLDLDDSILEQLDVVVASLHTGFSQDEEAMTRRLEQAMKNPNVDIIGHLTGRLIGKRRPYPLDLERVLETAQKTNTVLEINSSPDRLDATDVVARKAKERGIKMVVNTDAHSISALDDIRYGVSVARRGWLSKEEVLNTRGYDEILEYLKKPKSVRG